MKSRVLTREEKGMAGVSMKRLIFCGMGGGAVYFVLNLSTLRAVSLPALLLVFVILVMASGQRHGIPRYQWLRLTLQAQFMLHAGAQPGGLAARIASQLDVSTSLSVHSSDLFSGAPAASRAIDFAGLTIVSDDPLGLPDFEILNDDPLAREVV